MNKKQLLQQNKLLSKKYQITSIILINKKRRIIDELINNAPLLLWNKIHKKHSKISLVRTAYAKLKYIVNQKRPDLVAKANKEHDQHKAKKRFQKEINTGLLGGENSRFKKIASIKII